MIEKGKLQSLDSCESFSTEAVTSILLLESSPKAKIFSNFIFFFKLNHTIQLKSIKCGTYA